VAKFPDLTGDGEITQADVLKARGVFRHGGRVKKMAMGGRSDTGTAKRNFKSPPLSPDVEADLKALETLRQPNYTPSSGPRRRYPAGKVKRYPDEREDFGIPESVLKNLGKTRKMAKGGMATSASRRADGIAKKGKTKGRFV
jgi:hypothetical protein